jgi:hypothetical protein
MQLTALHFKERWIAPSGPVAAVDAQSVRQQRIHEADMTEISSKVDAVQKWLAAQFPEATIVTGEIFDRESTLFRVHTKAGPYPELEILREVLEDKSPDTLVRELAKSDALERLRRDPSVRIQYFRSGINHFETRYVQCDNRHYRIVRDDKHNVTIFDYDDRRLANMPPQMLVLPASIFDLQVGEWCTRIMSWRGEGQ